MASADEKPIVNEKDEKPEDNVKDAQDNTDNTEKDVPDEKGASGSTDEEKPNLPYDLLNLLKALNITREQVLTELTIKGIADYIQSDKCKNIIVMCGAGISTAAGIPDFRSPGTGLYSQLEAYNLPSPQSIFELNYYKSNPEPFCKLAKEMWPGNFKPTTSHFFIRLLEQKNLLLRDYSQNIDGLELEAGLTPERLIAAHGTFYTSHCIACNQSYELQWIKDKIFADEVPRCSAKKCDGLVKPDIVFFGESLPARFFTSMATDFPSCDLLIVMGTSLQVQPFCSLVNRVSASTPRLLINREKCYSGMYGAGFDFDSENKYRDVAFLGDCDDGCLHLAEVLGWKDELLELIKNHQVNKALNK